MLKVIYKSRLVNKEQYKKRMFNIVRASLIIILTNIICFQPISLLGKLNLFFQILIFFIKFLVSFQVS